MRKALFSLLFILFIFSACSSQHSDKHYYFSLTGKSETWDLIGYEIMLTPDGINVGNGTLIMTGENIYETDFFSFDTYVVVEGVEDRIHASSVAGQIDISEQVTGTIESEDGYSFSIADLDKIYMIVKWWDADAKENVEERIDLYDKSNKEDTFLN